MAVSSIRLFGARLPIYRWVCLHREGEVVRGPCWPASPALPTHHHAGRSFWRGRVGRHPEQEQGCRVSRMAVNGCCVEDWPLVHAIAAAHGGKWSSPTMACTLGGSAGSPTTGLTCCGSAAGQSRGWPRGGGWFWGLMGQWHALVAHVAPCLVSKVHEQPPGTFCPHFCGLRPPPHPITVWPGQRQEGPLAPLRSRSRCSRRSCCWPRSCSAHCLCAACRLEMWRHQFMGICVNTRIRVELPTIQCLPKYCHVCLWGTVFAATPSGPRSGPLPACQAAPWL